MLVKESIKVGDSAITVEVGRLAKQANGSVLIRQGDTLVLVTASANEEPGEERDVLPLICDYIEKTFAAGKIPGGFFKREGKPRDEEILVARLMDRPLRPLFPKNYNYDTQIIATVLSADKENASDILAVTGASIALMLSDIPFEGPIAGVRVGRIDGKFLINPTFSQREKSDIDLVVAVSEDAVIMVEGGAKEVEEEVIVEALKFAFKEAQPIIQLQKKLTERLGKIKRSLPEIELPPHILEEVKSIAWKNLPEIIFIPEKQSRSKAIKQFITKLKEDLQKKYSDEEVSRLPFIIEELRRQLVRKKVIEEGVRIGGRGLTDIRPIYCEVGLLPRTHGSALFVRGETQAIVTTTLGTKQDEQRVEDLLGESWKSFMVHYNFPPYSVGEVRPLRSPSRREIGHGALAERALSAVIPDMEKFPYTIRVVSEILESNGSSSMATVCGGSLSLMDAGVPIKSHVAGIAMGLIKEGEKIAILSDIIGDEDHYGDMDFKVAGTEKGITALQMDIKVKGLDWDILYKALLQAKEGRLYILEKMKEVISEPRKELSPYAPLITSIKIKPDKIRVVIGPMGKTIKGIINETKVSIDIEEDGTISLASSDPEAVKKAIDIIKNLTKEPEVGEVYKGVVKRVEPFGAIVEILPGIDGLVHISELDHRRVRKVEDVCKEGDTIEVKVIQIEPDGKIRLSRKELLPKPLHQIPIRSSTNNNERFSNKLRIPKKFIVTKEQKENGS